MLFVCTLCSILSIPVLIWPSIYYNVRRFRRTMDYWSGKSRLNQQVQVDKIVARPPPPRAFNRAPSPIIRTSNINRQPLVRVVPPNRFANDYTPILGGAKQEPISPTSKIIL